MKIKYIDVPSLITPPNSERAPYNFNLTARVHKGEFQDCSALHYYSGGIPGEIGDTRKPISEAPVDRIPTTWRSYT